MKNKFKNKLFV